MRRPKLAVTLLHLNIGLLIVFMTLVIIGALRVVVVIDVLDLGDRDGYPTGLFFIVFECNFFHILL